MFNLGFRNSLVVLMALSLSACIETTQSGLSSDARTKYGRIAIVPAINDNVVSTYWAGAFSDPTPTSGRLAWDARSATARLVREQLEPTGARVTVTPAPNSRAAKASDVVMVLKQTALNKLGQDYNPARDFIGLGGGLVAIAATAQAEENKSKTYQPRFVLWVRNPGVSKGLIGENACTVGLEAMLTDSKTGSKQLGSAQVIGRTIIPGDLNAKHFGTMPTAEKKRVVAACQSALRSAVSQALVKLNVAQ